jgi:hypothetical protein
MLEALEGYFVHRLELGRSTVDDWRGGGGRNFPIVRNIREV